MFAVIKTGGKQYKVSPQDIIIIEKVAGDTGEIVHFDQVLMLENKEKAEIAQPVLKNACVSGEIIEQRKAKKITVIKKKQRTNYTRKKGHRQEETVIRIIDLEAKLAKKTTKPSVKSEIKKSQDQIKSQKKNVSKFVKKEDAIKKDDLKKLSGVGAVLEKETQHKWNHSI